MLSFDMGALSPTKHTCALFMRVCAYILLALSISSISAADEHSLWSKLEGEGDLTVVFISGNGNDHSVWSAIAEQAREQNAQTYVYDRSGLGQSPLWSGQYSVEAEAMALLQALKPVKTPLVLVAHSYGGLISTLVAEDNADVVGMVLVDALLPADLSAAVVQNVLDLYTPRFAGLEAAAPELAKAIIPIIKAYPDTAARMQSVRLSDDLLTIDLVADHTWLSEPELVDHVRKTHSDFAAQSPARTGVFLEGSSHNVMQDNPDAIVTAIEDMLMQARTGNYRD